MSDINKTIAKRCTYSQSSIHNPQSSPNRFLIIVAVMSATLMQVLDTTIVNVALPHMQGSLSAAPDQISWTLTCYLIASAILMPLTGYFTDILGRKQYLLLCIAGFTVASTLCGMAQSLTQIIIFRLLQGVFGAGLVPLSQAILVDIHSKAELGKAMAIWGTGVMVGPILGPTLGGYLTDIASWRWTFYVNVPVGILAFLVAMKVVPDTVKKQRGLDWIGLMLISIAIGAMQYVLDRGNQDDWFNAHNITFAAVLAVVCLIGFIWYSIKNPRADSVFNIRIFYDRNFAIASLLLVTLGLGIFGVLVAQPLLLEELLQYPVLTAGFIMAPRGLFCMLCMIIVGKIIHRVDPRILIIGGIILNIFGMLVGTYYNLSIDAWWLIAPMVLQGFGMGMIFVPLSVVAFSTLPNKLRVEATGLYSLVRTIGSSIGIAVVLTIFTRHTQIAWNHLGQFVETYNPNFYAYLHKAHLQLHDPVAIRVVTSELLRQSQMLSFVDVFAFIMWGFVCMLPLVFLLRHKKGKGKEMNVME